MRNPPQSGHCASVCLTITKAIRAFSPVKSMRVQVLDFPLLAVCLSGTDDPKRVANGGHRAIPHFQCI